MGPGAQGWIPAGLTHPTLMIFFGIYTPKIREVLVFVSDEPTATSGVCVCGAGYAMAASGEFVTYTTSGVRSDRRNTDTISDGVGVLWSCPFCGQTEARGEVSGLMLP